MPALIQFPSGRALRLRVYPRPAAEKDRAPPTAVKSLPLFPEAGGVSRAEAGGERLARQVVQLCLMNRVNAAIIERFPHLGLADWWLAGGCLFQTVWNLRSGRRAEQGIKDYDIVYYADDTSEDAEAEVIRAAEAMFADLGADVQVRNQARVHVWYPKKFGVAYPKLNSASEGIMNFACRAAGVGLKRSGDEFLDLFAPFGLADVWNFVVTPNRSIPAAAAYAEKAERWKGEWPQITVHPWSDEN
ncbi:MAG: nucleotidyltransferase family protein [Rhodospirillaceae bacterium]|nr:nucleotidyltransferase family protein [Rhodospirillaceae bacterium]